MIWDLLVNYMGFIRIKWEQYIKRYIIVIYQGVISSHGIQSYIRTGLVVSQFDAIWRALLSRNSCSSFKVCFKTVNQRHVTTRFENVQEEKLSLQMKESSLKTTLHWEVWEYYMYTSKWSIICCNLMRLAKATHKLAWTSDVILRGSWITPETDIKNWRGV